MPAGDKVKVVRSSFVACQAVCCKAAEQAERTVVALTDCIVAVPAERIAEAAVADRRLLPEERRRPAADGS